MSKDLHEKRELAMWIFASSVFHAEGTVSTEVLWQKWSWWFPEISRRERGLKQSE